MENLLQNGRSHHSVITPLSTRLVFGDHLTPPALALAEKIGMFLRQDLVQNAHLRGQFPPFHPAKTVLILGSYKVGYTNLENRQPTVWANADAGLGSFFYGPNSGTI